MKAEDGKRGMKVICMIDVTSCGHHPKEERKLRRGDIIEIVNPIFTKDCFDYEAFNGKNYTHYEWFEPFIEEKKMTEWYSKVSESMAKALYELAKQNNFEFHRAFVEKYDFFVNPIAILMNYIGKLEFANSFSGWERSFKEIPLDEAVKILSVQQKKPLTAGGKTISLKEGFIEVEGVRILHDDLKKIYRKFKDGPLSTGEIVRFTTENGKYTGVKVGCTTATVEEVEAIAKELKL